MPYTITREDWGSYKKFWGHVDGAEFLQSIYENNRDPNFSRLRYSINDFLDVQSHAVLLDDLKLAAAHGRGSRYVNDRIRLAVVSTDPAIAALVQVYNQFMPQPVRLFESTHAAFEWVGAALAADGAA